MTLNGKFDAVIKKIASSSQTDIDIKNQLSLVFNNVREFRFSNGDKFDKKALVSIMIFTILEYKNEASSYARNLNDITLDTIRNFDEATVFVKDYTNKEIVKLIYTQPKFTNIIIEGLIDIYYKNKDFYFNNDRKLKSSEDIQQNDSVVNNQQDDRTRSIANLALIDEVLLKTKQQGTKGKEGFPQKEYTDDQMEIILTNLVKGNNNYITDKTLKAKISSISKEEIFAEVLKNALRLNCLCDDEKDLLEVSYHGIPPTHLATIRIIIHELTQNPIDNSNITSLIENIDKNTLTFLNKSFILSRKNEFMRNKISHAADDYQYTTQLLLSLDEIGNKKLMNEENFSK